MPELPEVESVKNGLAPLMEGMVIVGVDLHREGLRIPFPSKLAQFLKGCRIESLSRRAKYILVHLDSRKIVVLHLGMSGRIFVKPDIRSYALSKHDHLIVHLSNGSGVVFNDARRFGIVYLIDSDALESHPAFKGLGPEPLSKSFSGPVLLKKLEGKKIAIKVALMDQRVVAGVGNIYASEALFEAAIDPRRAAGSLREKEGALLVKTIRSVLNKAIASGGSTLRDYRKSDGTLGEFQHKFLVYGKDGRPCPRCAKGGKAKSVIQKIVQGGRATFFCPVCQK
jgi:formamidopyrimidine-DNA glycosylase